MGWGSVILCTGISVA